jgi:hypothetical protein
LEKETGKAIQEIMQQIGEGNLPKVDTIASMVKACTKLSVDECYAVIDEQPEVFMGIISEYADWCKKAFSVGEAGNSDSSTTAQS